MKTIGRGQLSNRGKEGLKGTFGGKRNALCSETILKWMGRVIKMRRCIK
jgi:hypothetical protein